MPSAPLQSIDAALAHPQTHALGLLQESPDGLTTLGLPLTFDGERPQVRRPAPELGADTERVLGRKVLSQGVRPE